MRKNWKWLVLLLVVVIVVVRFKFAATPVHTAQRKVAIVRNVFEVPRRLGFLAENY